MTKTGSFTTLAEWLQWLETLSPREIVLGLERVQVVLERLAVKRPAMVIHVGGTNGKGSSVAMLEVLLQQDGMRTGCYTSPHIHRYNERIRIDGEPASDDAILHALQLVESTRGDVPLTFFEFGTLAAVVAFAEAGVDAWVLEVGLGGRLDAINAIDPDASLITNVSLDHCAWLGHDTESIATEKAGIMRASSAVIFGSQAVPDAIRNAAADVGADLHLANVDFSYARDSMHLGPWSWQGKHSSLVGLQPLPLSGDVQLQNASAVLALIEALGMDHLLNSDLVNAAFAGLDLEGRFQVIVRNCTWIFDVAHNPAAAEALAKRLQQFQPTGQVTAIVGMLKDKDVPGVISPLRDFVERWATVTVNGARATLATKLAQQISELCVKPCLIADDIDTAMGFAHAGANKDDVVIVTGSFYLVGPALEWLQTK